MFNFNNCQPCRPQRPCNCNCQWENPWYRPCHCHRPPNNCNCNNNFRNFEENDDNFNNFNEFNDNYQDFNNNYNNYYPQDFGYENDYEQFQEVRKDKNCRPKPCHCHRPPQQNCCNKNCLCLLAGCLFGRCCNR